MAPLGIPRRTVNDVTFEGYSIPKVIFDILLFIIENLNAFFFRIQLYS